MSEIIYYDITTNSFIYIKENLLLKKVIKYYKYIIHSMNNDPDYITKITYNKNEPNFPLIYDWVVSKNNSNNITKNNDYLCFKLKISLPKIKFNIDTLDIKIFKYLNKHIIANLLHNKFIDWEKFIFFDLFSTKRFKIMMNYIMLNKQYKISEKKIYLNKKNKIQNKVLEFFITQTEENPLSFFYTFIPYIILILFGEKEEKKFQKINLTLKESKNLVKFKKYWGIMNTLFKCMFIDKMKNQIFFRLNLLDDNFNELYKLVLKENQEAKNINLINNNNEINEDNIKKVPSKNNYTKEKDKDKDKTQTKYKDNIFEISLLNCTLQKILINSLKSESKYYNIPPNILKFIFNLKDEKKIFSTNYKSLSIIGKCIGENISLILTAKEASIISEEQAMLKKVNKKEFSDLKYSESNLHQNSTHHVDGFNRLKTFQIMPNNNNNKMNFNNFNFLPKASSKTKLNKEIENVIIKTKTMTTNLEKKENLDENQNKINKIMDSGQITLTKSIKQRRVSITNLNELKKSRLEYGVNREKKEIERDNNKRKTSYYLKKENK